MGVSDEVLVARFKEGDESSFKELVERYQSRVYSIVLAMLGDKNDADDLSQEVFLKVYRFIHQFKGRSKFFTWLYRLTINTCISARNRKKRNNQILLSQSFKKDFTPIDTLQNDAKSPIEILQNRELEKKIKLALDSLSDGLKEVFVLREIEDLSYKQLSRILHCPEGTVKSRLFRAREELKKKLMPYIDEL
ncbi:RNA polymerase subunit sigma-24 [Candidatus Aerophobetes bacterium]|uniref:RNA polymerase subunit sigma-24 n=1 Tax=Aerophobetes bacterium TaxID=2030807 RepID=A0A662DEQ1_UNCAE|nr:MAG: RNA polymerase subunit sigma-24 [Candidatus Aerophobetes bacterium]